MVSRLSIVFFSVKDHKIQVLVSRRVQQMNIQQCRPVTGPQENFLGTALIPMIARNISGFIFSCCSYEIVSLSAALALAENFGG